MCARMPGGSEAVTWNAAACVIWATLIGGLTYLVGPAGVRWIAIAGIAVAGALVVRIAWSRRKRPTGGTPRPKPTAGNR